MRLVLFASTFLLTQRIDQEKIKNTLPEASAKDGDKVRDSPHGDLGLGRLGRYTFLEDERVDGFSAGDACIGPGEVVVSLVSKGWLMLKLTFSRRC